MTNLVDQLRQLHEDLGRLIEHDSEQEVTGQALPLLDAVISEGRRLLPSDSPLSGQIVEMISAETIEAGEPLRAADALVVVGQLLAVLGSGSGPDERLLVADRKLVEEFRTVLPSASDVVNFLRYRDLAAPFRWETIAPLEEFCKHWDNSEHTFHDKEVESERQALLQVASDFLQQILYSCGPEPGDWYAVVPAEHRDIFRLGGYEHYVRRVDELNDLATALYDQHQQFLAVARRRLGL